MRRSARPNGSCDAVTAKVERFFRDISRYGGGPTKISMMIIALDDRQGIA
ncbi:hypothetical protein predicted by Glimmer/Critica (plasmid) [Sinorhizobium fredii HH103]|uniref:Uncharacterized protein n=1 Tax=Sinorhizobium fredii (strain HH103) TaxID=1117943 RepID=G9AGI7_SINF1|nr:hypothetical protein predicted by Glimmer/Critica [Sinorhizobium fredii HH103]